MWPFKKEEPVVEEKVEDNSFIASLIIDNDMLRELVKEAYLEGATDVVVRQGGVLINQWDQSDAKKKLEE